MDALRTDTIIECMARELKKLKRQKKESEKGYSFRLVTRKIIIADRGAATLDSLAEKVSLFFMYQFELSRQSRTICIVSAMQIISGCFEPKAADTYYMSPASSEGRTFALLTSILQYTSLDTQQNADG
jgi:hypothetical protein